MHKPYNPRGEKGFTLIELLVVIAIVAILAVVLVLTLNPAQILAQARDSTRISDLNTVKTAISLYLADIASPSLGTNGSCYVHASSGIQMANTTCSGRYLTMTAFVTSTVPTVTTTTARTVAGSGWIPVNLTAISSGAPLSIYPIDPINNATYFYSYAATSTTQTFELNAKMESTRYSNGGGANDVESQDGGSSSTLYEVGTAAGLSL